MIIFKEKKLDEIIERKVKEAMNRPKGPKEIEELVERKVRELVLKSEPKLIAKEDKKNLPNLKPLLKVDFMNTYEALLEIFNDEDNVIAAISMLDHAPEEIKVLSKIILDMYMKSLDK